MGVNRRGSQATQRRGPAELGAVRKHPLALAGSHQDTLDQNAQKEQRNKPQDSLKSVLPGCEIFRLTAFC